MVPIQRETLLTGAVFVCIVAAIFLFRELNNVKDQINQIGDVSSKLVRHANSVLTRHGKRRHEVLGG